MKEPANISRRSLLGLGMALMTSACLPDDALGFAAKRANGNEGHDEILEAILFGESGRLTMRRSAAYREAIDAINYASYLCIDQAGNDGSDKLEFLKQYGVPHLPTLDELKLPKSGKGNHRQYTHKGWYCAYDTNSNDYWQERKSILLQTVNKVFDFGLVNELQLMLGWFDDSLCDAFAELVYCVHILGDYQEAINVAQTSGTYSLKKTVTEQCIPYAHKFVDEDNRDLLFDLSESLQQLFDNEVTAKRYSRLTTRLKRICRSARKLGPVEDEESAQAFQDNITELREILNDNVPELLKETEFFNKTFYREQ